MAERRIGNASVLAGGFMPQFRDVLLVLPTTEGRQPTADSSQRVLRRSAQNRVVSIPATILRIQPGG